MAGFGGAVKLTGESEYRKALKNITQNLREVSSEMKLVSAQYSNNDKSTEALTAKTDVLTKKLDQQKDKVALLKKQYAEMASQYDANKAKNDALAKKYDEEKAKLSTLEKTLGTTSEEYKEQAEVVQSLEQELQKSTKAQDANEKSMSNLRIQLNNAEADVAKTSNEIEKLSTEMDEGASSSNELGDSVEQAGKSAESANGGFTVFKGALADLVANVIASAVDKMKELVVGTIDAGKQFESSMANVQAISGATDDELKLLSDTAKEFGSTTKFSASESADALGYMALAGWDAKTSAEALGGVLNLASASGMDLAQASDMVTDYLSAFGLEADKSAYFADILAYAQGNANTTAEGLGEAYKNCSANLASAGQDIETTTALLSMMANQGLKGSEAGTALNAVVRDMTSKMKDGSIAIGDTLVQVQDANGNFRDLSDILKDVETATDGMGSAQKESALMSTFTADSIKGLNLILNAGVDEANSFEDALRNSTGTAEEMATTMQDNLGGDLTSLSSKIEGVQIAIYEKLEPALRAGVEALSAMTDGIAWLVKHGSEVSAVITGIATATGVYVAYTTALKVMKDGWTALTVVTKAQTIAQTALNAVMSMNPIGVVIALVAGLVTAFIVLWNKSEAFRDFWIGLWDTIKGVAEPVIDGLVTWFTNAWETIKGVWNTAVEFFTGVWNGIQTVLAPVVDFFGTLFGNAYTLVSDIWIVATYLFQTIWDGIKNVFAPVADFFGGIFGGAWNAVKAVWDFVVAYYTTLWNGIKAVFSPVVSFFSGVFSQAWESIKAVFNSVGSFFGGIWNTIKGVFVGIGQKAGDAIGGAFKSAINAVLKTAENVLNAPINAINSLISTINKLPNISLSKLSTFSLPRLAKGGVVNGATIAEIGEAGAEAVVPLENNTAWITKVATQLAKALAVPLANATQSVTSANQAQNSYNNTVEAFKDALGQMKIVLDDEEMGSFVEKTVADAIYT
jgi:TP901 family phage tail tape measure protein